MRCQCPSAPRNQNPWARVCSSPPGDARPAAAAQACFGTLEWPAERTVPQASIEFEVESAPAFHD